MKPLYIAAVSGGVDSVVMLDQLVKEHQADIVVAHVDHGIRPDSAADRLLVKGLSQRYGLPFETTELRLGAAASENTAREARWQFLRTVKEKYSADKIATAHHADDVVETMIINLLRGTGWRGIATLRETQEVVRPLLRVRKIDNVRYATEHELSWHEDSTNDSDTYLRNRVRRHIIPRLSDAQFQEYISLHDAQLRLRDELESYVGQIPASMQRYPYIMMSDTVAYELLRHLLGGLTMPELKRGLLFIRTAKPHKRLLLSNQKSIVMSADRFIVLEAEDC